MPATTRSLTWISADGTEIPLTSTDGIDTIQGPLGLDTPPVELDTLRRSEGGAARAARVFAPRTVVIPLVIYGRTNLEQLIDAVVDGSPGRLRHSWTDGDPSTDRTLHRVEYVAGLDGDETIKETMPFEDVHLRTLRLDALDPWWHGPEQSLVQQGGPLAAGQPWVASRAWSSSAIWNGGSILPLRISSKAGVWPIIEVAGYASLIRVIQTDTNARVETAEGFALSTGSRWRLTTEPDGPRAVTLDGATAWWTVTQDSDPGIMLTPTSRLAVTLNDATASTTLVVRWDERFVRP